LRHQKDENSTWNLETLRQDDLLRLIRQFLFFFSLTKDLERFEILSEWLVQFMISSIIGKEMRKGDTYSRMTFEYISYDLVERDEASSSFIYENDDYMQRISFQLSRMADICLRILADMTVLKTQLKIYVQALHLLDYMCQKTHWTNVHKE
jgi:hypothetical protein